ncbi:restriction endonuclease subunit S [Selenomonas bovis]|uniref:restriction endonuclease subunit S n=1 Tax=Selenomonas bovis TaxID=416586 RepID=UPI0004E0B1A1|nr:restriction endonuclease subunit S [Selenomonas bovis]
MAKKKQDLTPEERLAAALVPEEENMANYGAAEYPIVLSLGNVIETQYGYTEKSSFDVQGPYYLRITDIQEESVDWKNVPKCLIDKTNYEKYKLKNNDIVVARTGATTGKSYMICGDIDAVFASYLIRVQVTDKRLSPRFLYLFFQSPDYWSQIAELSIGIAQPGVNARKIRSLKIRIPTIDEQQRIVARIESLFAKLDAAREKVQSVLDSHETRKAALLHDAFAGKLTAKWRDGQSTKSFSWKPISFEDCIEKMQNGLSKRKGDAGEYVNVLRLTNIAPEGLSFQDMRKILLTSDEKEKYKLAPEDVLMVRVNGSKDNVGKQLYIDKKDADNQLTFCDHLIRIHYNEQLVAPQFMVYFSHTMQYKSYVEKNMVSSAGQNTISRKGMKNLSLMLPSLPEQQQIVRILDRLLAREQRARQAAEETLTAIDRMKQAILARAFRGEL